jgi:peptidoglycan hydrolase CwlO-like protein
MALFRDYTFVLNQILARTSALLDRVGNLEVSNYNLVKGVAKMSASLQATIDALTAAEAAHKAEIAALPAAVAAQIAAAIAAASAAGATPEQLAAIQAVADSLTIGTADLKAIASPPAAPAA